jgi:uncharacterized membrane protein YjgN (DUF898 family)
MDNKPPAATTAQSSPGVSTITAAAAAAPARQNMELRFTGSAMEYFRIWIVNVCLTLVTLGIFSAWAKVRKKRYFYSHTLLDDTPFQYLGMPIPILKGRLIAAALFTVWYVSTHFVTTLVPLVILIALALAPWVIVRAAAFNARYSAYRNMTFNFAGSYIGAAKVMYGWAIATLLTLGIGYSWWHQRMKRYMVHQSSYGGINGEFSATGGQFFKTYLLAGLLFFGALVGAIMLLGFGAAFAGKANRPLFTGTVVVMTYAAYVMVYAYIQTRIANLTWNNTQLGPLRFNSTIEVRGLLNLYLTNALGILASAGLLIPWATVRTLKYRVDHFSVQPNGDLKEFEGSDATNVRAAGAEVGDIFDFDMSV